MRRTNSSLPAKAGFIMLCLLCIASLVLRTHAQGGGPYILEWSTIDGGGGVSTGGPYTLSGTIGQPDADWSRAGVYELLGGFWAGGPLCFVEFGDFARFADHWLETPCGPGNDYCGGADLDKLGDVDFDDLSRFTDYWLDYCPYAWPLR